MMCVCVRLDILLAMIAHYILIENYIFTQTHIQLYANVNSSQTVVMDTPLPCVCVQFRSIANRLIWLIELCDGQCVSMSQLLLLYPNIERVGLHCP